MRYTVNYYGAVFTDDNDGFNCVEFNDFQGARELLYHIIQCSADLNAYIKDEEYQCYMHWDEKEKEFYWEA